MAIDPKYLKASDGTGSAVLAHITVNRLTGATTLKVDNVDNWPPFFIATTGALASNGYITEATKKEFRGHLSGADIVIDAFEPGFTDTGNTTVQVCILKQTTGWADGVSDNLVDQAALIVLNATRAGYRDLYGNAIINGGAAVAQRNTAPNLSTTYQYGKVDRFAAKATGTLVSAGTIAQTTTPALTTAQNALKLAGTTITGTGIVFVRYRMEARDAVNFKNSATSFSFAVRHDIGVSVNATIYINKATAADNFASVTAIANSGALAIPSGTDTLLKFENINAGNIGDVTNGIEIEIQIAVGAITLKNIEVSNFVFNKGATVFAFAPRTYQTELQACLRYFYPVVYNASGYYSTLGSAYIGGGQSWIGIPLAVPLRTTPTVTLTNVGVRYGGSDFGGSFSAITQQSAANLVMQINSAGTGNGNSGTGWISPGGNFTLDAEL